MNPKDLPDTEARDRLQKLDDGVTVAPPMPTQSGEIRPDYYKVNTRIVPQRVLLGTLDVREATIECLSLIDALDLNFNLGNALKYLWRAGRKTASKREDLRKCLTYIQAELDREGTA